MFILIFLFNFLVIKFHTENYFWYWFEKYAGKYIQITLLAKGQAF